MNYMEQVAQMLGVELEEEFYLKGNNHKNKLSKYGFFRCFESNNWVFSWDLCEILTGRLEIIKEPKPILDETEKRYLSNVIKPFRDKVSHICKRESANTGMEWIQVGIKEDVNLDFPNFEKGTMYKGMELDKEYSLEDLGL